MIRVGYASDHQEDVLFLQSAEVLELLRAKNFLIEPVTQPIEASSVDVLFADANKMNKLTSATGPVAETLVLLSSKKTDALRAWNCGAAYFLLRPYSLADLKKALERAEQDYYWKKKLTPPQAQQPTLELLLVKGRKVVIPAGDILFFEAQGEMTRVVLVRGGQEKIMVTRNLGYWERLLDAEKFIRVHKKYVVNIGHLTGLFPDEVHLGQFTLPLAKRRRKVVEKSFFSHQMVRGGSLPLPQTRAAQWPLVDKK